MKIAGRIIRKIRENTSETFWAEYKGLDILVTTDHGHGKPKQDFLKRFDITVTDKRGCYAVDTLEDHHEIKYAIISALEGAKL